MKIHNPKSKVEFLKLATKLDKKYKGQDYSRKEAILLSTSLMNDICSSLVDMQNRIEALEQDND